MFEGGGISPRALATAGASFPRARKATLLALACLAATPLPPRAAFAGLEGGERDGELYLANDLVEVRFSAVDGSPIALRRRGGRDWISPGAAIPFAFSLDAGAKTVWDAREGTRSGPPGHVLSGRTYEEEGSRASWTLSWSGAGASDVAVALRVEMEEGSPWIRFRHRVENLRAAGVVTTLWGPILSRLSLPSAPTVVWPALRGEIHRRFSGFLSATYPRPASMQWLWAGGSEEGLYYGVHDATVRYKELRFGADLELGAGAAVSVKIWCFVPPGGRFEGPEVVVGPVQGDWHAGAERYREFVLEAGWRREPADWVRSLRGWSNLWVKDSNQVLLHPYAKIPERLLEIHPRKIDLLDVFGWHRNGFDTYYPDYVPLEDAGGEAGLEAALSASRAQGDRVMLYFNARIAHPESDWYRAHPAAADVLLAGGTSARETYGGTSFFVECPSSSLWRSKLAQSVAAAAAWGADGIWVDQLAGANPYLCYARSHRHADPALAFAGLTALAKDLRREIGEGTIFTCEGELDALGAEVDIFGTLWFLPFGYEPQDAPEVLRYTLPGKLVGLKAQGAAWGTAAYHAVAFLLGAPLLDDNPGALRFLAIYDAAPECFYRGRFLDDVGLSASPERLRAKLHLSEDAREIAVAVWNGAASAIDGEIALEIASLGFAARGNAPGDVLELPGRESVPFLWDGTTLRFSARYPAQAGSAHLIALATAPPFRRGDSNCDGAVDISDPLAALGHLFLGGAPLLCERAADANSDGALDVSDAVFALSFLFLGTHPPPPPFPHCGADPSPGLLACASACGCTEPRAVQR